jgi:hypothetical protein
MTLVELLLTIVVVGLTTAIASDAFSARPALHLQRLTNLTSSRTGKGPLPTPNMTDTATTLTGRTGRTLQPKTGAPTSDRTDFQC